MAAVIVWLAAWGTCDILVNAAGGNQPGAIIGPEDSFFDSFDMGSPRPQNKDLRIQVHCAHADVVASTQLLGCGACAQGPSPTSRS